jgi:hypothetical protein
MDSIKAGMFGAKGEFDELLSSLEAGAYTRSLLSST